MNFFIDIFEWIIIASIKTVPIIFLVWLLQRFVRKWLSAAGIHALWLLVLLSLTLPLGWEFNTGLSKGSTTTTQSTINIVTTAANTRGGDIQKTFKLTGEIEKPLPVNSSKNNSLRLCLIWLCGIFVIVLLIAGHTRRYRKLTKNSIKSNKDIELLLKKLSRELGIRQSIEIKHCNKLISPITFGLHKPVILLPDEHKLQLNDTQLRHILLHELTHIKRRDIAFCWFATLVVIFHWFNPFVWLALSSMRKNMELACDADVLNKMPASQHRSYGETLISLSDKNNTALPSSFALGILENHHQLKERIFMLTQNPMSNFKSKSVFALLMLLIAISALAKPNMDASGEQKIVKNQPSAISLQDFSRKAETDLEVPILVGEQYADEKIRMPLNLKQLDYGSMLSVLRTNGYTAYRSNGLINIIPVKMARSSAVPVAEPNKQYHLDEFVTSFLTLNKACAWNILPVLRPMVPQHSHLAASEGRSMVITDSYGNIKRLERVIAEYEKGLAKQEECREKNPSYNKAKPQKKTEK